METLITNLQNMDLNAIGIEGHADEKHHDLGILLNNEINGNEFNLENSFNNNWDNLDIFNTALINIHHELNNIYAVFGQHGSVNVGVRYRNYIPIRDSMTDLSNETNLRNDLNLDQRRILCYILLPVVSLPNYTRHHNYDNPRGEKTFSKMVFNSAMMLSLARWNHIHGYWTLYQLVEYNDG